MRQPLTGATINWKNPLTRGLVFFGPRDHTGANAVGGEVPTIYSTNGTVKVSYLREGHIEGWAYDLREASTTETDPSGFEWATMPAFIERGLPSTGGTTMAFVRFASIPWAWTNAFGINDTNDPWYQGSIVQNSSGASPRLRVQNSSGLSTTATTYIDWFSTGPMKQLVATFYNTGANNRFTYYTNGAQVDSDTQSGGYDFNVDFTTPKMTVGAHDPSTGGDHIIGTVMAAALWNRELTPAEVAAMYANPWQIFKGPRITMPLAPYTPGPPEFAINIVSDDNTVTSTENPWIITGSEMGEQ